MPENADAASDLTGAGGMEREESVVQTKFAVTALSSLALLGAALAVPAQAATAASGSGASVLSVRERYCINEVGENDRMCRMAYNGDKWWTGDWVAVHVATDGSAWANAYSNKTNKTYYARVRAANGEEKWSETKWGGTGVGVSAGAVNSWSGWPTGTVFFGGGGSMGVTARP
ncbi:hypothetical protein [Streptomyces sp. NPDC097981]|uniref:hypothetical protein n=1 Tax=Streptomyces sp. NPDC097981 TaxID=3155428 RepID=UPI00332A3B0C